MTEIIKSYPHQTDWKPSKHKIFKRTDTSKVHYEIHTSDGFVMPEQFDIELEKLVEKYSK